MHTHAIRVSCSSMVDPGAGRKACASQRLVSTEAVKHSMGRGVRKGRMEGKGVDQSQKGDGKVAVATTMY